MPMSRSFYAPCLALGVLLAAAPAAATTITEYDGLAATGQQSLVDTTIGAIAQRHAADAAVGACITAYGEPAPGGDEPRLETDFAALLERSRAVAPDDFQVENLLEGLIMVECHIAPTE